MSAEQLAAIATIMGVWAWPVVAIVFILSQRAAIDVVVRRIKSAEGLGLKLGVGEAVETAASAALLQDADAGKRPTPPQLEAAVRIERVAQQTGLSDVRDEVFALTREYDSVRATTPFSNDRTRRFEVIVTKMRMLALAAYPLLSELKSSSSAGARLAAEAILQVKPAVEHCAWLAERPQKEQPFVFYHAAVALKRAAELVDIRDLAQVRRCVQDARANLKSKSDQDSQGSLVVLDEADRTIDDRVGAAAPAASRAAGG